MVYLGVIGGIIFWFGLAYFFLHDAKTDLFIILKLSNYPKIDFAFFSLVTFATVGYGDFIPANPFTKILVAFEIFTGVLTLILIKRIPRSSASGSGH
jgi:hypothetical protein